MEFFTIGLPAAFSLEAILYCLAGVALGTFIGVLPGLGPLAAVSLLLPITVYLDPLLSLIMLAGIYYGAEYGGAIASILLNMPGTPGNAITCLDGYPMSQKGRQAKRSSLLLHPRSSADASASSPCSCSRPRSLQ